MAKDKSENKKNRRKKIKKVINKVWVWGTVGTLGIIVLCGVISGLKTVSDNREEMVLEALNYYNQETLGYVGKAEEPTSRALVFEQKDNIDADKWDTLVEKLDASTLSYEFSDYYNLKYCNIVCEGTSANLGELHTALKDSGIEAWEIYDSDNAVQYYGSQDSELQTSEDIKVYQSTTDDLDVYLGEIKDILSKNTTVLVESDYFGVIYLTKGLGAEVKAIKDELESVDYTLVLARILKCGNPQGSVQSIVESYDTIAKNR